MQPYTYLIGWTHHNKYYYGVRYANKQEPNDDLWKIYFTSSRYVQEFREKYGEPDIIKVDKIFSSIEEARDYELEQLKKIIEGEDKENWLNKSAFPVIIMCDEIKGILREKAILQFKDKNKREFWLERCRETDAFHTNKIWINKDKRNKRVTEEKYKEKFPDWNRGRYIPEKNAFWDYDKRGENNPFYNKRHSTKSKMKMSEKLKGRIPWNKRT